MKGVTSPNMLIGAKGLGGGEGLSVAREIFSARTKEGSGGINGLEVQKNCDKMMSLVVAPSGK